METQLVYQNVLPTKNVIGTAIAGNLEFKYNVSVDHATQIQNSYFYINGYCEFPVGTFNNAQAINDKISTHGGLLEEAQDCDNFGVVSNPVASLINSCDLTINNVLVQRIEDFGCHTLSDKVMNSSFEEELSSGSPYLPHSRRYLWHTGTGGVRLAERHHMTRERNAAVISFAWGHSPAADGLNPTTTEASPYNDGEAPAHNNMRYFKFQMAFKFPFLATSMGRVDLLGNNNISVVFQLNGNAKQDMFLGTGLTGVTSPTILRIDDMQWAIPLYKTENVPKNIKVSLPYTQTQTYRTLHTSSLYSINMPSGTHLVTIHLSYARGTTQDNGGITPERLVDCLSPDAGSLTVTRTDLQASPAFQQLYINFNGKNYPSTPYNLIGANGFTATSGDIQRAYQDYRRLCGAYDNAEQPLIRNFRQFMSAPVFAFNTRSPANMGNGTSTLTIYATAPATAAGKQADLNVCCYFDKQLDISYGEYSNVEATDVSVMG